jgi:hypothetical protein
MLLAFYNMQLFKADFQRTIELVLKRAIVSILLGRRLQYNAIAERLRNPQELNIQIQFTFLQ